MMGRVLQTWMQASTRMRTSSSRPRVVEVLNSLGVAWPLCREHRGTMGACEGWWYCNGEPYHDVAGIGALEQGQVTPPAA